MALSSSVLASLIQSNMRAAGARGVNLEKFCTAIATGVVASIVGKTFTTLDVGVGPGTGSGIGTGITGLSSDSMQSKALSDMHTTGYNAGKMMKAVMDAVVSHLSSSATLTTVDPSVLIGTGTVVVGSITVNSSEMGSNIDSEFASMGAVGKNRGELSNAIGDGICSNIISSGTGTTVITGSGSPSGPASGTGTGVIS